MNKAITINDIAKIATVSKTTVSRFLNGKFEGMSEETRLRIQAVVEELDYRPNRQARALKAKYSSVIGITVTDISNPYNSRILKGIMDRLKSTEYRTIILDSDLCKTREHDNIEKLIDEQIDGLIIQPLAESSHDYAEILKTKLPVVQVDRFVEPLVWPAVVSDNFIQSKNLGLRIKDKDYERVIVLTPPMSESSPRKNRYKGLLNALIGGNVEIISITTPEIREIIAKDEKIWAELRNLLQDKKRTAIFAFNGALLYGAVKFLNDNLIAIPGNIGVVGYDDSALGELISPGITSIEQNPVEIGYRAVDILLQQIIEGPQELSGPVPVDSKLNIRKSL
ncbi:MAG: LacI family transcriptional regulator [Streptococcaceae bacterium]|jgi:LacI family kdg operon repressor|nr:LacI family transcriptional regulator [Streptococcaceae bacterium]